MKKRCNKLVLFFILIGVSLSVSPLNCAAQLQEDTESIAQKDYDEEEKSSTEQNQRIKAFHPIESESKFNLMMLASNQYFSPYGASDPPVEGLVLRTIFDDPIKGDKSSKAPLFITDRILQINAGEKSQLGAIWSKSKLDLKKDFNLQSYIYLGDRAKSAGDGMTFTLQADSRMGTSEKKKVIGTDGSGIGAYSRGKQENIYIRNALSLEFDTFYNKGTDNNMDVDLNKNSDNGHIAFATPSNANNKKGQHTNVKYPTSPLSNKTWRKLDINWNAEEQKFGYVLEGVSASDIIIPDLEKQFGGTEVYWGFTGSTGGNFAQNVITVTELPQDLEQTARIKNETVESEYATATEGAQDDIVVLKDKIAIERLDNRDFSDSKVKLHLADGLTYQENSIEINGEGVDENQISVDGQVVTIREIDFSNRERPLEIEVGAKVTTNQSGNVLSSYFSFIDLEDEILSESNPITVKVIEPRKGTVTVRWLKDQTEIRKTETMTGIIGEAYNFENLKEQDTYVWLKTVGDVSGLYQKGNKDLTFYYQDGIVQLTSCPERLDFGKQKISTDTQKYWANLEGKLAVTDNRGSKKTMWRVTASEEKPLENESTLLPGAVYFVNGSEETAITSSKTLIKEKKQTENGEYVITDQWTEGETGLRVEIPVEKQRVGQYKGKINWNLENVPSNEGGT